MDPLSLTASTAGLVSLSFQLFAGCIQGFVLISTAQNLGKDASTIICMLNLQEIHLTEWARTAGLLDDELDRRLNVKVVEETLQLLEALLKDTGKLKSRYKLDLIPLPTVGAEEKTTVFPSQGSDVDRIFGGISKETRNKVLLRAGLIKNENSLPKRLWWAAVDKENMEKLVEKINTFVRQLWFLLDPWRQDDLLKSTQTIASNMIALVDKFEQLKSLNDALQKCDEMTLVDGSESCFKSLAISADIKAMKVGLDNNDDNDSMLEKHQGVSRKTLLQALEKLSRNNLRNFQPMRKRKDMGIAWYDNQAVFIEWKELDPYLRKKVIPRVENLAALMNLPKDPTFRSLHCRGTIESDNNIAFVYTHPSENIEGLPKSLYDLFSAKDGIGPPSLTERIKLALCIAQSVRSFHRSGWLHKDLRSENILFFRKDTVKGGNDSNFDIGSPVLAGFSFSRFASPSEISEQPSANPQRDIYRHPNAMGEASLSFNAFMDLYSLGTILVEIAEWRALKFLVQSVVSVDDDAVPLSRIAAVQQFLLNGKGKGGTSKIRSKMGDIYHEVCVQCLAGDSNTKSAPLPLLDSVVEQLESCRI